MCAAYLIRLRSIGDTVLTTPSLYALKRFLPDARIDILLEDWVAPVLEGFPYVNNVLTLKRKSTTARARVMRQLRSLHYDVVYNLHGGTTATLLTPLRALRGELGWRHISTVASTRIWLLHLCYFGRGNDTSVEQQLALLGWTGVPVSDRPPTQLAVASMLLYFSETANGWLNEQQPLAVIHPAAAFATKQWSAENFAGVAKHLYELGLAVVVITAPAEAELAASVVRLAGVPAINFSNLSLPEVTALASRARLFAATTAASPTLRRQLAYPQ